MPQKCLHSLKPCFGGFEGILVTQTSSWTRLNVLNQKCWSEFSAGTPHHLERCHTKLGREVSKEVWCVIYVNMKGSESWNASMTFLTELNTVTRNLKCRRWKDSSGNWQTHEKITYLFVGMNFGRRRLGGSTVMTDCCTPQEELFISYKIFSVKCSVKYITIPVLHP